MYDLSDSDDSMGAPFSLSVVETNQDESRVNSFCVAQMGHLPDISIKNVSLRPPVYHARVVVDESRGIYGDGRGDSSKSALAIAYHKADVVISSFSSKSLAKITSVVEACCFLDHDLPEYCKEPWYRNPKTEVNSMFLKKFKRPPEYLNQRAADGAYLSTIVYDSANNSTGRGKSRQNFKEAEKLAACDLLVKMSSSKVTVPVKMQLHTKSMALNGRPPFYDCVRVEDAWHAKVEILPGVFGVGISKSKLEATQLCATDALSKVDTINVSPQKVEQIPKVQNENVVPSVFKSAKQLVESSHRICPVQSTTNSVMQPLRDGGVDADFIRFVADVYQLPYPPIELWSEGPPHDPKFNCRIVMRTPKHFHQAACGPEGQKKTALSNIMLKFGAVLREHETELWVRFKSSGDGLSTGKYTKVRNDNDLALYRGVKNFKPLDELHVLVFDRIMNVEVPLIASPKSLQDIQFLLKDDQAIKAMEDALKALPPSAHEYASKVSLRSLPEYSSSVSIFPPNGRSFLDNLAPGFPGLHIITYQTDYESKLRSIFLSSSSELSIGDQIGCYFGSEEHVIPRSDPGVIFTTHLHLLNLLNSFHPHAISSIVVNCREQITPELQILISLAKCIQSPCSSWVFCPQSPILVPFLSSALNNATIEPLPSPDHSPISFAGLIKKPAYSSAKPVLPSAKSLTNFVSKAVGQGLNALILPSWNHILSYQKYLNEEPNDTLGIRAGSTSLVCLHESMKPTEWFSGFLALQGVAKRAVVLCTELLFTLDIERPHFVTIVDCCIRYPYHGLENGVRFASKSQVASFSLRDCHIAVAVDDKIWEDEMSFQVLPASAIDVSLYKVIHGLPVENSESSQLQNLGLLATDATGSLLARMLVMQVMSTCGVSLINAKRIFWGVLLCCLDSAMTLVSTIELFGPDGLTMALSPTKPQTVDFSDHVAQVLLFYQWKNSRNTFFSEKDEHDYCLERGLDLDRLHKVDSLKNQLYNRLDGWLRCMAELIAMGLNRRPQEVVNDNNAKLWLLKAGACASVASLENICACPARQPPISYVRADGESLTAGPQSIMHNFDANGRTSEELHDVFFYEWAQNHLANMISRLPMMGVYLLGHIGQESEEHWLIFNSRDLAILGEFRKLAGRVIDWISGVGMHRLLGGELPPSQACDFINHVLDTLVELIGHQAKYEQ